MTRSGLRQIMHGFEILELGVRPYQNPSLGLIMQIETLLPLVASADWRDRLDQAPGILKKRAIFSIPAWERRAELRSLLVFICWREN